MKKFLTLIIIAVLGVVSLSLCAQEQIVVEKEAPKATLSNENINFDKNILKRTPTVDGKILPGEWDIFYDYTKDANSITTYANWDFNNFYLGISCDTIEDIAIALDVNSDGWTIGEDNYLITTNEGNFNVLKAIKTAENGVTLVAIEVPEAYQLKGEQSIVNGKTNLEISIPAYMINKNNFDNGNFNFNIAVKTPDNDWVSFNPQDLTDNTIGCKLVNHKAEALEPLSIEFYLTREKIVAGDTLDGKVKIKNRGKEPISIKELVMAGEGLGEDVIDSYKIKVGEIRPGRTFEREYHSKVLVGSPVGCKVVGCEIYTDDMKIGGALRSFEIINSYRCLPIVGKEVYYTKDKTIRIGTRIISYTDKKNTDGYASVIVPEGWSIEGSNRNKFKVSGYNKYTDIIFRMTPPLGTIGTVKIPVVIKVGDNEETIYCNFQIVQTK